MDASTAAVRNNPAIRGALFMALTGICLLAYVVSGWMDVDAGLSVAAPGSGAAHLDGTATTAMVAGFGLLLAACALLLRSRRELVRSALRDPLTGLYTELFAAEVLQGLVARDDRAGHSRLVLVRVEINTIDEVRRRYGRKAVDLVMGSVGRHIRSQSREDDLPVEPDGRGFAIYLHSADLEQARAFCRRLATLIGNEQMDLDGEVIKVSANMRVTARKVGESIQSLHQRAVEGLRPADALQGAQVEA